jgi:tetratricopeptide (TPR) repeat protein
MPKKKIVSKKLEKAKKLLAEGEIIKVNGMLNEIIIFPITDNYSPEYAKQLIQSLHFLKEVCRAQNISKDNLIDPVLQKLTALQVEGGKIDSDIVEPLELWINKMGEDVYSQANQLLKEAENGNIEVADNEREEDFTTEIIDPSEINIINQVGTYLLKRKFQDGIQYIDANMPKEMTPLKASLLDSKAGLFFMAGKVDKAVECYNEILFHYVDNYRIKTSLAEAFVELKDYEKAITQAKEVLNFSRDNDNIKICRKIVNKYAK